MSKSKQPKRGIELQSNMISYMKNLISKEVEIKKNIESSGQLYYGSLPSLEQQLDRIIDGSFWGKQNLQPISDKNTQKTTSNKQQKKIPNIEEYKLDESEIDDMAERLHIQKIEWAKTLSNKTEREGWLSSYDSFGKQNKKTGEYWIQKYEAVSRPWVLEMWGLLPHQNGVAPSPGERRKIWEKNYDV